MPTFPRAAARAFRAVVRKGVAGRSREPAPPVVLLPDAEAVTFLAHLPTVVITCRVPTDSPGSAPMVVPMAAFDAVAGSGSEPVTIEPKGKLRAELRWSDRGQPQTQPLELERFTDRHERPAEPADFTAMPPEFLRALHEAGRTAGPGTPRYAFDRIQLRGASGEVVGSNSHEAFLQKGFRFPFAEDRLVAALPLFGTAELRKESEIGLGCTDTHLVLRIGPWTLFLLLDVLGRYPDVANVVPKSAAAVFELGEADAGELLATLPRLPGDTEDRRPITLDLVAGQPAIVRARSEEMILERSVVSKGSVRVAVDRSFLDRASRLGCRRFQAVSAEKPVVARGGTVLLLAGALDPDRIAMPDAPAERATPGALVLSPAPTPEASLPLELATVATAPQTVAVFRRGP